MIEACPNLNDPEVAREFNEIKEATSEKTAYNIWSLNNGYGIDKAPNGAKSILFESLLRECNGDKTAAIRAKAALYGNRFREWFGDWLQEDKTNVSKVVDENGEPLVVYHGTTEEFTKFDPHHIGQTDYGDRGLGYYFSPHKKFVKDYGSISMPVFLNIKEPYTGNQEYFLYRNTLEQVKKLHKQLNTPEKDINYGNFETTDGYIDKGYEIVVYSPNQIKSATGNIEIEKPDTGFSTTDDDINHVYFPLKYITEKTRERFNSLGEFLEYRARYYFGSTIVLPTEISNSDSTNLKDLYDQIDFFVYNLLQKQILENIDKRKDQKIDSPIPSEAFLQNAIRVLQKRLFTGDYTKDREFFTSRDFSIYKMLFPKLFNKPRKLSEVNKIIGLYLKDLYKNKGKYLNIIENYNKEEVFSKIAILNKLTRLNSELTNSVKIKKNIIHNFYRDVFNYMKHSTYDTYKTNKSVEEYSFMNYLQSMQLLENAKGDIVNGKLTYSVKKILLQIKDTDPRFFYLCDRILSTVDGDISLYFNRLENTSGASHYSVVHDGKKYHMISVNENNLNEVYKDFHYIIMHEVVHSVTSEYLKAHPRERAALREYIDQLKLLNFAFAQNIAQQVAAFETNSLYGFENEMEFVAEFFTNSEFREALKSIKPLDQSNFKSLFEQFVNFILGLFGINQNDSAYDLILPVMQHVLENGIDSEEYNDLFPHVMFDEDSKMLTKNIEQQNINIQSSESYSDVVLESMSHMPVIQATFDSQRENWIRSQNPQTDEDRAHLARLFDLEQLRDNTNNIVNKIASEYNLYYDGNEYTSQDERGKYMAMLVNSIQKRLGDPNFAPIEAAFLNCTLLGNNDISTLILQMAKVYIEDFYQADAILEAMKIIDPKGTMHKDDLVAELTNLVVKAVVDPSSVESGTLTKINNKIVNFVRKRFGRDAISEEAKLVLIDAIAKNMSCCNDLERTNTEDLLHDVKWYEITGKESQVTPKDIINQIKRGIKIQIKALKSVTNVDEAKVLILNQLLAQFEDIDLENNPDDVLGVVSDFIAHGMVEINNANADLRSMLNGDPADIDDARLYQIKTDVIGYYRAIVNNYIIPFTRNTNNPSLQPGGALYATVKDMLNRCTNTQHLYDYVLQQHTEALIDRFVDSNVNIGDKERFKVNCKLWLHNKVNNGDLGFFENWIKSAVSSHSPIVRVIDMFVREYDTEVRQLSIARARRLQNMYKQCEPTLSRLLPFNYQRMFCEIDSDGQTTGNFLAAVNVGQFEKEKKAFIDRWIEEREVVMGEDGILEFPDDQTWKDFNDAYDDFLEGKQHRRYTAEYYKLERLYMSRDTIEYRRNIRHRIQLLYDKCFDKEVGAPNIWKLDRDDMQRLQDLLKLQLNLSNPYIIEYDSNGKISSIIEKTGDLFRMAEEIGAFNKAIAGKIKFSPNYNKYNAAKEAMKNKFGEDSMEYKWFVWNFSSAQVKSEYYDKLRLIFGPKSEYVIKRADIIDLKIRAIINATLPKRGKYILDLSKMSDEAYAELKSLEEAKYHLFENVEKTDGKKLTEEEKAELAKMHHYEYVKNPETNKEYIKELEELYRQLGRYQEFLNKYFVTTSERVRPLSIFSYDAISQEYIDYETPIGMFSDVDINSEFVDPEYNPEDNEFMNVDKKRYHNDKYDEMIKDPQAKKFYDEMLAMMEEAWSMLPDINRHYKYMLPLRRGNISQLFARDLINTFTGRKGRQKSSLWQVVKNVIKLTAIGAIGGFAFGSILTLLPATWMAASTAILSATSYGTITGFVAGLLTRDKNIADRLLSVTENDIEFNETYAVRPDGSEVETIPIRFVRRLDDPTAVSTSLIHSVSSFYEMALNYKLKEKLAPIVENILFELSGGFSGQSITDQADRIRTHKSAMIYGRRKTGITRRSSNKMTESEQKITKLVQFLLNTTHAKMLPGNGTSIYKNAIDSVLSFLVNVVSGKFITLSDIGSGIIDMGKDIVNGAFSNIGKADTKSFTGAAMLYNGLHMSVAETFDDTEKYWLRRVAERFYSMGPFTFIDYTFKGLFLHSIYNTYRLVLNPSTGKKEFMNKQEAQFAYADTLGRKEGLKRWKESNIRLKNAYEVTEEGLKLKPEFESIVRPIVDGKPSYKLETRVSGLAKEQTAVINGMLDSLNINKISQNFIGASILLMRGWMVSQLIDYNKDGLDFAVFASNTEEISKLVSNTTLISLQSKIIGSLDAFVIQSAPTELEGQYNFATGFIERGWWVGWIKACRNIIKHRHLTRHNKYQLKALATILITTVSLGLLTHPLYDWKELADSTYKDKDPYNIERVASNFLYTGTVAAYSERFGQVGPFGFMNSFLELVNSPTVASSYVKDLNSTLDACEDLITLLDAMYNGEDVNQTEPMQIVKRGSFKGHKKITRDLLKASSELPGINTLGVANIYKTISPDAQKEKLKFYKKTIPFAGAQPWVKLPESVSSSNKQVKPKKAEEDLSWIK